VVGSSNPPLPMIILNGLRPFTQLFLRFTGFSEEPAVCISITCVMFELLCDVREVGVVDRTSS
jgi:hypothetical protein